MTWTELIAIAADYAKCTPRQAREAWKAACLSWGVADGKLREWRIAGIGTLHINGGSMWPLPISGPDTGGPHYWYIKIANCTNYLCDGGPEMDIYALSAFNGNALGWNLDQHGQGDIDNGGLPFLPEGMYMQSPAGWEPGDPIPGDDSPSAGVKKIRFKSHKGVIERHRAGDI